MAKLALLAIGLSLVLAVGDPGILSQRKSVSSPPTPPLAPASMKDASPELREKIIEGRIRSLENQIKNFRRQIEQAGGGG